MAKRRSGRREESSITGWFDKNVKVIFLGLLAVAVVSLTVIALGHARPVSSAADQPRPSASYSALSEREKPTVVAFLGDSYVAGSTQDSGPKSQWSDIVSSTNGWVQKDFAVGGSGYFQTGTDGQTFADRVDAIIQASPDVVIVSGGFNDPATRLAEFQPAVNGVLTRLRAGLPESKIVVLSNFVPSGEPTADQLAKRDALSSEAGLAAATFIDVTDMFTGRTDLISVDGTHPTDAGHARIAEVVGPQLVSI